MSDQQTVPGQRDSIEDTDDGHQRPALDVSNAATMADWLRDEVGQGPLSGFFQRSGALVHTPREGEGGYVELTTKEDERDGAAQIRAVNADYLAAQVQYRYDCAKPVKSKSGKPKRGANGEVETEPALFPMMAAKTAVAAPADMLPNVRKLAGVIHTPIIRKDGSLLDAPGYDAETRLYYVPPVGYEIPYVPEEPTEDEMTAAVGYIDRMLSGFPFLTEHDRANYIGMLMTPLLRLVAPPPYKMLAIEAHQRSSGKTKLAKIIRTLYDGLIRSEMPSNDDELGKQVTAILSTTTAPAIIVDNVTGMFKSSKMAGLLTSDRWDDRPLGVTAWTSCVNDRLWIITGNNFLIGGDLPRRTIRTMIDPNMPRPEERTDFEISDLDRWVMTNRAKILHSLLTILTYWRSVGGPVAEADSSDDYAWWTQVVRGILGAVGIPGTFDHKATKVKTPADGQDWGQFLQAIHDQFGLRSWTVGAVLAWIDADSDRLDLLPSTELTEKAARSDRGAKSLSKTIGKWLSNREGQWPGEYEYTVRQVLDENGEPVKDRSNVLLWRIHLPDKESTSE